MMTRTKRIMTAAAAVVATAGIIPTAEAATHAGDSIVLREANSDMELTCTLNAVRQDSDGRAWGVTAAHCFGENPISEVRDADGQLLAGPAELRELELFRTNENDGVFMDTAFFPLRPGLDIDYNNIYSRPTWDPAFAMLSSNPDVNNFFNHPMALGDPIPTSQALRGQIACQEGASMGRTCGVILDADPEKGIIAFVPTIPGDSGGPLHVLGADGKRHIVGSLTGGPAVFINVYDNPADYIEHVN